MVLFFGNTPYVPMLCRPSQYFAAGDDVLGRRWLVKEGKGEAKVNHDSAVIDNRSKGLFAQLLPKRIGQYR
jgi:hypothetical protein